MSVVREGPITRQKERYKTLILFVVCKTTKAAAVEAVETMRSKPACKL